MELLKLDENGDVQINKVWIKTNPILNALIKRDKSVRKGQSKESSGYFDFPVAKTEFKLITLLLHPDSEYFQMDDEERLNSSLELLGMSRKKFDKDEELLKAIEEYKKILNSLFSYKALIAVKTALKNKIDFIGEIDFSSTDKQGRLLVSLSDHSKGVEGMSVDIKKLKEFESLFNQEFSEANTRFRKTLQISDLEKTEHSFKETTEGL